MADKPILFSAPMVRALLAGRKTQTRRLIEPESGSDIRAGDILISWPADSFVRQAARFHPRIRVGDRLWVKEAWRTLHASDCLAPRNLAPDISKITYEADPENRNPLWAFGKLRPLMFMPRWASRITLIVTDVRVQRLQDISEEDAIAEGIEGDPVNAWRCYAPEPKNQTHWADPRESYRTLWDSINGDRRGCTWKDNPWVAAYSFRVVKANIDQLENCNG